MLTRTKIRNMTYATFYARGLDLYLSDKIKEMQIQEKSFVDFIQAKVKGSGTKIYNVKIQYDDVQDELVSGECDCPAFYSYDGLCKHIVAVLLKYADKKSFSEKEIAGVGRNFPEKTAPDDAMEGRWLEKQGTVRETTPSMKQLLNQQALKKTAPLIQNEVFGKVRLEPLFFCGQKKVTVEFRIGVTQMYVLKDVLDFADRVNRGEDYEYGKKLKFLHLPEAFESDSRGTVAFIRDWARENEDRYSQNNYYNSGYYGYMSIRPRLREIPLSGVSLEKLLEEAGSRPVSALVEAPESAWDDTGKWAWTDTGRFYENMEWVVAEGKYHKKLRIAGQENGILLKALLPVHYQGQKYDIYFEDGHIYLESRQMPDSVRDFEACMEKAGEKGIYIQEEDIPSFCRDLLPALEDYYECEKVNFNAGNYNANPVSFEIYLDAPQSDVVTCRVMAVYGERKYNVYGDKSDAGQRDIAREIMTGQAIAAYCDAYDPKQMSMAIANTEDRIYQILTEGIPKMQELGEVYISDALKRIRVVQSPHVKVGVSLDGDLLELSMTSDNMSKDELIEILSRYHRKKKYYRLKNGDFIKIEGRELGTLSALKQGLGLTEKQLRQEQISLPKYRALYLDSELKGSQDVSVVKNRTFKALIRDMRTVEDNDFEVPGHLEGVLREYQKKGFLWLKTLKHNGFGGILADDMGLGKTLQVLAFLDSEIQEAGEEENRRCLIITPASLVYNWYSEIQRFVPRLSATMVVGSLARRQELIAGAGKREILITSYDLLKRDIASYQGKEFFCQIIDEAQFIKNYNTQAAKAVKEIAAACKFALTGTPVENRLSELWSIFDYLMPGFLFPYQRFREELEIPIIQQQDKHAMEQLQKMIRPFVLRRLKKDVLKDLPDKLEEEVYAAMEGEQRKLYDAHVKRLALMLDKQTDEEFRTSKIQILSELTRLRQLCCDPSLLYENYTEDSAKREMCLDLVRNAVSGGHKVLLFSQFTSMLDILCRKMDEEKISYFTLTGSTSKEKRKELVDRFQRDETNVFCISLKAGGTGLNLTAADIVIHYDPWWNLAVQNQATDRAHRIGQENAVTVYKLITKGTIEENILRLQEKKVRLAEEVLGGEEIGSGSFTREELMEIIGFSMAGSLKGRENGDSWFA